MGQGGCGLEPHCCHKFIIYYPALLASVSAIQQDSRIELVSLGGHFACLCRGFEFYEVKKIVIIFQKENGSNFTLLIIFIVKSLQKEQNSTNLLL